MSGSGKMVDQVYVYTDAQGQRHMVSPDGEVDIVSGPMPESDRPPHNFAPEVLYRARELWMEGNNAEAWRYLAEHGDTYADDAYNVVGRPKTFTGDLFGTLVEKHWDNTAGPGAYQEKFNIVAGEHLGNYLDILDSGYLPTQSDIEQSYRDSVVNNGLPPQAAFDGTFTRTIGSSGLYDWPDALGMESFRMNESHVFDDLGRAAAWETLVKDVLYTGGGLISNWASSAWESLRGETSKLYDDVTNSSLFQAPQMILEWITGTGPNHREFGPGSGPVYILKNEPGVIRALEIFHDKNSGNHGAPISHWEPMTGYSWEINQSNFLEASPLVQLFIGSYNVNIYPGLDKENNPIALVQVTNPTSLKSFLGIVPKALDWGARQVTGDPNYKDFSIAYKTNEWLAYERWEDFPLHLPGSVTRQTYWWTEPLYRK